MSAYQTNVTTANAPHEKLIDIHTHGVLNALHTQIINLDIGANSLVDEDAEYLSVGIHPWSLVEDHMSSALANVRDLAARSNVLAIGECGLDKLKGASWELQQKAFMEHIQIASQWHKPLIIHCVKAQNDLIRIVRRESIEVPMIIHGFDGNLNIAHTLLENGFYLSFGKALLRQNSNAYKALMECPQDRMFLETDDSDIPVDKLYETAAAILGLDLSEFIAIIRSNFTKVFRP